MRVKIHLETQSDAIRLVQIASSIEDNNIYIADRTGHLRVHAKSVIGVLYSMEFKDLWLESEKDYYSKFQEFM